MLQSIKSSRFSVSMCPGDPVSLRTDSLLLHSHTLCYQAPLTWSRSNLRSMNFTAGNTLPRRHRRQSMKRHMAIWGLTASVLVSLPLTGTADDQGGTKQSVAKESQGGQVVHTAVYQPPRKGAPAPGIRRGGGTRGPNK